MSGTTCASPIYYCKEYFAALRKKCKLMYVYRKGVDGVLLCEKSNYRKIQILSHTHIKLAGRIKCRSAN